MEIPIRLILYGLHNPRMTMTGITDTDAADKIEIGLTGSVIKINTLRFHDLQTQRIRRGLGDMTKK